jgi:branched-chain amino acid aminotransferase/para-aminobenzoate synthetase component 1
MQEQVFVWLNDGLVPLSQARVSVEDRGFLYGDGFFETLRVEDGRPLFLEEHLERLDASARAFNISFPEKIRWEARLVQLLEANDLRHGVAAVKILLTRGEAGGLGLPEASSPTLVMWARTYSPPSPEEYAAGWPVVIFPERRTTFIGAHKSLNYLFYLAARQYALDRGAREALVLEAEGLVSEGAATSLILAQGDRVATPAAPSALPGVTVAVLAQGLQRQGKNLEWVPLNPSRLEEADGLWLANSLMGLMPVSSLDGRALPLSQETSGFLMDCLAAEAVWTR